MPKLWLTFLWFCFISWIDWKSWNDPLIRVFYTCCILCVIIGQKCNLWFSSCKWIFNYTYVTVHKSMSKLLCNSLWNWSWGNAYIHSWVEGMPTSTLELREFLYPLLSWRNANMHSWVEGIPASTLAEGLLWIICTLTTYLPFVSSLWNWHSVFCYVIYHDISFVSCRMTILTGNKYLL